MIYTYSYIPFNRFESVVIFDLCLSSNQNNCEAIFLSVIMIIKIDVDNRVFTRDDVNIKLRCAYLRTMSMITENINLFPETNTAHHHHSKQLTVESTFVVRNFSHYC